MVAALTNCKRHIWNMRTAPKITHKGNPSSEVTDYFLVVKLKCTWPKQ